MRLHQNVVLEEPIIYFLHFAVCLQCSMCYHYRDFDDFIDADPHGITTRRSVKGDPMPALYKYMSNFIAPPKSSPTKAGSSASQASMLDTQENEEATKISNAAGETQENSVLESEEVQDDDKFHAD